jgi:hypothetical protein
MFNDATVRMMRKMSQSYGVGSCFIRKWVHGAMLPKMADMYQNVHHILRPHA